MGYFSFSAMREKEIQTFFEKLAYAESHTLLRLYVCLIPRKK